MKTEPKVGQIWRGGASGALFQIYEIANNTYCKCVYIEDCPHDNQTKKGDKLTVNIDHMLLHEFVVEEGQYVEVNLDKSNHINLVSIYQCSTCYVLWKIWSDVTMSVVEGMKAGSCCDNVPLAALDFKIWPREESKPVANKVRTRLELID